MSLSRMWNDFWFRPASPHDLIAMRILVALDALWLVASRPFLPDVVRWPDAYWKQVSPYLRARFLIPPLPFPFEMALYAILAIALVAVVAGFALRVSAMAAALLIYHFAPMEDIFNSLHGPFFRGFTIPLFGLLILAFAERPVRDEPRSAEYRWPVALIQLLFAFTYLLSGLSKLRISGLAWTSGANFESIVQAMMIPDSIPPWAHVFVGHPLLCWAGALAGTAMDFLFIAAVFSRKAARVIVPLTLVAHLLIIQVLGVVFLEMPLLLLFVDWEWVTCRLRRSSASQIGIAAAESR